MKHILNKYRTEYGRTHRREYEQGSRKWGWRSAMKSYQARPDKRTGAIMTSVEDNLVIETYEK